jgi:dTDP-4-dehydrorhamnose reductase
MKVILTGANGFLGQYLSRFLLSNGHQVVATGKGPVRYDLSTEPGFHYSTLDITSSQAFAELGLHQGEANVLIHAAAMSEVDACEQEKEKAYLTNVKGTENALAFAAAHGMRFIFISTDFVFDGARGMYKEDDPVAPVNYYGYTKKLAEDMVFRYANPWLVIRTCLVYGNALSGTRSNIITWVKANLEAGKTIKVVSDQVRTPTQVEDLAHGVIAAMEQEATGIYHISGGEVLTPYDMALATARMLHLDARLIEKVDASVFTQLGQRPLRTGFVIDKARNFLQYDPMSFEEGIQKLFPDVKQRES